MIKRTHSRYLLVAAALVVAVPSMGGAYIGADTASPNLVAHPSNYVGGGGNIEVRVCISPASSVIAELVTPVQNVINTMNLQQPTTGNLIFGGANDIPSNAVDAESALLHETGHCIGLAHPNLATESGLPAAQRDYTKSAVGSNASYDLNAGTDGVPGSQDDLRGDDLNLHWFRVANNNPFTLDSPVDATTYSRNVALLPGGSFVANAARAVSTLLGVPNTEAVMQQGQSFDEAQRTLGHDDVATLAYARSGVDEVAGTADDHTTTLVYQGVTSSGCDITVSVDADTGFASCSVGLSLVGGGDHYRITTGTVRLNNATNWYYNQTSNAPPPNAPPVLTGIGDVTVEEGATLNVPLSASDADAGDTLSFFEVGLPPFCALTDNGNRTADLDCAPGLGDEGTYTTTVFAVDDGEPILSDSEAIDVVVTANGVVTLTMCSSPQVAIPDDSPAGVTDDLIINVAAATIVDLNLSLRAAHSYVGDLSVSLEHVDSGTAVAVLDRPGVPASTFGCSGDDIDVFLDDEGADGSIEDTCNSTPPAISGTLLADELFGAFDAAAINGTWRLTVADNVAQDTGTLEEWCINATIIADPEADSDGDGVVDAADNCLGVPNAPQRDSNGDGYGNLCDADLNNDCIVNTADLGLLKVVFFAPDPDADFNGDGIVNTGDLGILRSLYFGAPGPSGLTTTCDPP